MDAVGRIPPTWQAANVILQYVIPLIPRQAGFTGCFEALAGTGNACSREAGSRFPADHRNQRIQHPLPPSGTPPEEAWRGPRLFVILPIPASRNGAPKAGSLRTPRYGRYGRYGRFGAAHCTRPSSHGSRSAMAMRSWLVESRCRSVTVSFSASPFSPIVSKSIVMQNGVPASSCRA